MSKTMLLQQFVRSFPLRACEVTRVAQSKEEFEIDVCQQVKGNSHNFTIRFEEGRSRVLPWVKMQVQRCSVFNETLELVDESGKIADVSYKVCNVIYADDYEKAFSR